MLLLFLLLSFYYIIILFLGYFKKSVHAPIFFLSLFIFIMFTHRLNINNKVFILSLCAHYLFRQAHTDKFTKQKYVAYSLFISLLRIVIELTFS